MVFYDENMTKEEELSKVPLKIELIDANDLNATPLYTSYKYFSPSNPSSRVPVLDASDLNALPAVREALFKITYATDANGAIVQKECGANYQSCFETLMASSAEKQINEAKDTFAIRPESFFIKISDREVARTNSNNPNRVNFAAGYDYNLTIMATKHRNAQQPSFRPANGYNGLLERTLDFNSSQACINKDNYELNINMENGLYNDLNFTSEEVGNYILKISQDNNWTAIDQNGIDCKSNESFTSQDLGNIDDFNIPSGCNIVTKANDIKLNFHPYQFGLDNVNFSVLPIDDNEFIYMDSELDTVGVQLIGEIIAQNAKGDPTHNFTQNCVSTDLNLGLELNITSDTGVNTPLQTTIGDNGAAPIAVTFNRSVEFNNNDAVLMDSNISDIRTPIVIRKENFLDNNSSQNGSVLIDLRYNISKNINRTINPIEIDFETLRVSAENAQSNANKIVNWTPTGVKDLNETRFFYFTQVAPDSVVYPRVNFLNTNVTVNTPISVDIFCQNFNNPNFCENMNIFENTSIHSSPRKEEGWYISINHNENFDGNITTLDSLTDSVTVNPNNNIPFRNGQNYQINSTVRNTDNPINRVNILTPSHLTYRNPYYSIPVTGNGSSEWTGIGKAGNMLNTITNTRRSDKMDW